MIDNPLCRRRYYSIHYSRITAENQMKSIKQRKLLHFKPIHILINRLIQFQSLFIIECAHYYTCNRNIGLRQYSHDSMSSNLKPYTQLVYFKNDHRWPYLVKRWWYYQTFLELCKSRCNLGKLSFIHSHIYWLFYSMDAFIDILPKIYTGFIRA